MPTTTVTSVSGGDPGAPTSSASGLEMSGAACQQADEGRDERQEQALGKEARHNQVRRAADGLQKPGPPGAFRHPTPDKDGHARECEQAEQLLAGGAAGREVARR
jgi:hypothetical protein